MGAKFNEFAFCSQFMSTWFIDFVLFAHNLRVPVLLILCKQTMDCLINDITYTQDNELLCVH